MGDNLAGTGLTQLGRNKRLTWAAGPQHQKKRVQGARSIGTNSHSNAHEKRTTTTTEMRSNTSRKTPRLSSPTTTLFIYLMLASALVASLLVVASAGESAVSGNSKQQQPNADTKAALEAELNSFLTRQELAQDPSGKLLSEAIISRLMLGNLSDIGALEEGATGGDSGELEGVQESQASSESGSSESEGPAPGGLEALRLRKMLAYLQNYEMAQGRLNGGQVFSQYPVLPASQAATIKRASLKMGNYLRQQQQQHAGQRQLTGYGRVNSFDFGLGKRPDASVSGNILRLGDSASTGGHMVAVSGSGLGKRPSAHRYDFGLGKRVASVSKCSIS